MRFPLSFPSFFSLPSFPHFSIQMEEEGVEGLVRFTRISHQVDERAAGTKVWTLCVPPAQHMDRSQSGAMEEQTEFIHRPRPLRSTTRTTAKTKTQSWC